MKPQNLYSILVNNNLCRKLVSSLELSVTFDESFKVSSVVSTFKVIPLIILLKTEFNCCNSFKLS